LVGQDLPQISRSRRLLILPWTKFSVPIIICYLRPASYLAVIGSGGMDPIVLVHSRIHSEPVLVPSILRGMVATADVLRGAADSDRQVKICSMSSYSPQ
jgi:hypothetical protein